MRLASLDASVVALKDTDINKDVKTINYLLLEKNRSRKLKNP